MSGPLSAVTAPSALDPDARELAAVARRWLDARAPSRVVRAQLEAAEEELPPFWDELSALGWIGLAVPEAHGGGGGGLSALAVVLEEWGRGVAPGPFPGTAVAATLLGHAAPHLVAPLLAGEPAAVAWNAGTLQRSDRGVVGGALRPVDGGGVATWFLAPVDTGAGDTACWCLLRRDEVRVDPLPSADPTRRLAAVAVEGVEVPPERVLALDGELAGRVVAVARAAECVGLASWCVRAAVQHAVDRVQFGQPIGRFQAVKHRCADSLCRLELARAATWDAATLDLDDPELGVAADAAASLATAAAFECAKDAVQVLGAIGYTWEHDAHLYLRRATVAHHLGGGAGPWRRRLARAALAGHRRSLRLDLPPEADAHRAEVRELVEQLRDTDRSEWNRILADGGWLTPHWPAPWGREAGGLEQLVIDEELRAAGIRRPHLQVAGWVLPTLIAHGTAEQQQRFVPPSLRFEVMWCQLFSEPGAGSDLASVSTVATPVDGGWSLTGQKVWTTLARQADYGLCLARTDPEAPKHEGLTCFVVDMRAPGVEIRPLRELTGSELFNEVFLDGVHVPDDGVVGAVGDGWRCARTTLENERVSMSAGSSFGPGIESLLQLAAARAADGDPVELDRLGELLATAQALAVLGLRTTLRALDGAGSVPGPEASVRKLVGVELDQRVQEAGMALVGPEAVVTEGDGAAWFAGFLGNRALSIAGGTSEIQRNVIAERLLGLPRDSPEPAVGRGRTEVS